MSTKGRLMLVGTVAATMLIGGAAFAQLTKDEQKCLDCYNNKLRLVGQQAGKDYRKCVKDAGKGKVLDAENCVDTDAPGKIAGKATKVNECYTSLKCTGAEPIQQGAPGTTGINAMISSSQDLVHDVFGDPIAGVVTPGKDEAKCQDAAFKDSEKLFTTKLKAFRKCKKDNMKTGTVTNSANLETTCMTPDIPDPSAKISSGVAKLKADVNDKCAMLPIATLFQGLCASSASTAALGDCLEQRVECRVCLALNAADGTARDCDLFDDGVANDSCLKPLPQHTCNISTAMGASLLTLNANILGGPVTIPIPITGSVSLGLDGGAPDVNGKLGANCNIINIGDINAGSIGWVCVSPFAGCPEGEADCNGGNALGISAQGDGNTGACASEAACDTSCVAFCAPNAVLSSGCTGFCTEGAQAACTSDAQCLGASQGSCNGPDAGSTPNICQCSCINSAAGGASAAGDFQCNLGSNIQVRGMGATSCTTGSVTINVGQTCIPLSTQVAQGQITDANFTPALLIPPAPINLPGARVPCATLQGSTTTGIRTVGAVNFFGSTLGDLAVSLQTTCQ